MAILAPPMERFLPDQMKINHEWLDILGVLPDVFSARLTSGNDAIC